ncbi:hypothetical protein ACFQV8_36755 [Pseudonocardia benzenivorans]
MTTGATREGRTATGASSPASVKPSRSAEFWSSSSVAARVSASTSRRVSNSMLSCAR